MLEVILYQLYPWALFLRTIFIGSSSGPVCPAKGIKEIRRVNTSGTISVINTSQCFKLVDACCSANIKVFIYLILLLAVVETES